MNSKSSTMDVRTNLKRLKDKADVHLTRKVWHFTGVIFIVVLFHNLTRTQSIYLSLFAFALCFFIDFIRLRTPSFNKIFIACSKHVMRERECHTYNGTTALLLGTFVVIYVFPPEIAKLALLCLAVADPLASYVGVKYGKDRLTANKSLQGSSAAFAACFVISLLFFFSENLFSGRMLIVSLLTGLTGSFSELINIKNLDDNLTFPILQATLLHGLFIIFGAF